MPRRRGMLTAGATAGCFQVSRLKFGCPHGSGWAILAAGHRRRSGRFPGYLRHLEVVTRVNANQLAISAKDRWAEPLDRDFKRVLADNLMRLLDTQQILQYPWYPGTQIDYQIVVSVRNFKAISGGQSRLRGSWLIKDGKDGRELYASETIANTPLGSGNAGVSAALSNELATPSRAIAAQVTQLSHERAASPQVMAYRD